MGTAVVPPPITPCPLDRSGSVYVNYRARSLQIHYFPVLSYSARLAISNLIWVPTPSLTVRDPSATWLCRDVHPASRPLRG